jgi:hypothetical protein
MADPRDSRRRRERDKRVSDRKPEPGYGRRSTIDGDDKSWRDPDQAAMTDTGLHETYQGRYGGVAPYSRRDSERGSGSGYERDHESRPGTGPTGYERSDARIREDVCDRLVGDPYLDAGEIGVQVSKGEVTLTGSVDNQSAKRRAEDLIGQIIGVRAVRSNLRVKQEAPRV